MKVGTVLLFLFSVLIFISSFCFAQQSYIQMTTLTPSPAKVNEEINIQVVLVNAGATKWNKNRYSIFAKFFDDTGKFLYKSEPVYGKLDLSSGQSTVMKIKEIIIPPDWQGMYKYKVYANYDGRVVDRSKTKSFEVIPGVVKIKTEPEEEVVEKKVLKPEISESRVSRVKWAGNIAIPYQNRIGYDVSPININANISASTEKSQSSLYTNWGQGWEQLLFEFNSKRINFSLGDISPQFSDFTMSGTSLRGGMLNPDFGKFTVSIVGGQSVKPEENYNYAQYIYGSKVSYLPSSKLNLGVSYILVQDDENSIHQGIIAPIENSVVSINTELKLFKFLSISGEYGNSKYDSDINDDISGKNDIAWQSGISFSPLSKIALNTKYCYTGKYFNSLGAPGIYNDRIGFYNSMNYGIGRSVNFSLGYDLYHDNVKNNPDIVTTRTTNKSFGMNIFPSGYPTLNGSISLSDNITDDESIIKNQTISHSVGTSYNYRKTALAINYSFSQFRDKIGTSNDFDTKTPGLNFSTKLRKLSLNADYNLSKVINLITLKETNSNSISTGIGFEVIPEKFNLYAWYGITTNSDNVNITDNQTATVTADLAYFFNKHFGIISGFQQQEYKDEKNETNNYKNQVISARLNIRF